MPAGGEGDVEFGADTVGAGRQQRLPVFLTEESQFTVETEERGDVVIIQLGGHITEMGADQISNLLDSRFEKGAAKLVFDLTAVKFMSSTGLGQIMRAYRSAASNSGYVKIVNPQPLIADLFRITKLDKLLPICTSVEEAMGDGDADADVSFTPA